MNYPGFTWRRRAYKVACFVALVLVSIQSYSQKQDKAVVFPALKPDLISIVSKDIDGVTKWYEQRLGFKVYKSFNLPQYDSLRINFLQKDDFKIEIVGKKTATSR